MKTKSFCPDNVSGHVQSMNTEKMNVISIKLNSETKEIFIEYEPNFKYSSQELKEMKADELKTLMANENTAYTNKDAAIGFLSGVLI